MGTFSDRCRLRPHPRRSSFRPLIQVLEDRSLLATFTVTNTGDNNGVDPAPNADTGTLRQAIVDVNADTGATPTNPDVINFFIPGSGVQTITPTSPLPAITHSVIIDGYSQPGAKPNTSEIGDNAVLMIVLNGANAPSNATGLSTQSKQGSADNSIIQGLVVSGFGAGGISVGSNNTTVRGNFIGTDVTGTQPLGNGGGEGENVFNAGVGVFGLDCTIGGIDAGARNVISGNRGSGLDLGFSSSIIQGNYIGTDVTGTKPLGNSIDGIFANSSENFGKNQGNLIGGTTSAARNVISGNEEQGIQLDGIRAKNTVVQGNFIGTDATGKKSLGNGDSGVFISNGASHNIIGGTATGTGNLISGNTFFGLLIQAPDNFVQGNYIGTDKDGTTALGNNTNGVELSSGSDGSTIGGTATEARNVISGNGANGVLIQGSNTVVQGNYIGTDKDGMKTLSNGANGVQITADATADASGNLIGGTASGAGNLISGNNSQGILLDGAGVKNTVVEGNLIGTDATGTNAPGKEPPGNGDSGVFILNGASHNTIGGVTPGARNVISGNTSFGLFIQGPNNVVQGNCIGTDQAGTTTLGNNSNGVVLSFGSDGSTIGGTMPGTGNAISDNLAGNLISGNGVNGVLIQGSNTVVQGNYIGTDKDGIKTLSNGVNGVQLTVAASNNTIGGTTPGAGNVISGNLANGVVIKGLTNIVQGNFIGTDKAGKAALPNLVDGVIILPDATGNTIGGTMPGMGNAIPGNLAGNLISGNSGDGVASFGPNSVVQGNFIGTDRDGKAVLSNSVNGVFLISGADGSTIGGTTPGAGNVISGNLANGVVSQAKNTVVAGNFIGTDLSGMIALFNLEGGVHLIKGADDSTIGGTMPGTGNAIPDNLAGNLISGNLGDGVASDANRTVVQGNYIGTDRSGNNGLGNVGFGVSISSGFGNRIGGTSPGSGNVIASNFGGINAIQVSSTMIQGNLIGADKTGTMPLGNRGVGILLNGSTGITIGGLAAGAGNLIVNNITGVSITGGSDNPILGNSIQSNNGIGVSIINARAITIGGTAANSGNTINSNGTGVSITGGSDNPSLDDSILGNSIQSNNGIGVSTINASAITIGGTTADARNIIDLNGTGVSIAGGAHNLILGNSIQLNIGLGVSLISTNDNEIGRAEALAGNTLRKNNTGVSITNSNRNSIIGNAIFENMGIGVSIDSGNGNTFLSTTQNSIYDNGLGIDIAPPGPTLNDPDDSDTGANNLQNFPDLTEITTSRDGTTTRIRGSLSSTANTSFILQFFSDVHHVNRIGQGRNLIDQRTVTTNDAGKAEIDFTVPMAIARGEFPFVSATATNLTTGETSEFSPEITEILYTVTNTSDSGQGSLRQAIMNANENPIQGVRSIDFSIPGPGPFTIALLTKLPAITTPVDIDGTTQPGFDPINPVPMIELTGRLIATPNINGLTLSEEGAGGSTVRGLVINEFTGAGIALTSPFGSDMIEGNYIGTDVTGTRPLPNSASGVSIINSRGNTIGGTAPGSLNVISGNGGVGIFIVFAGSTGTQVLGNYIGTDVNGIADLGNESDGILITAGADAVIGGTTAAARNVISGNQGDGVVIDSPNTLVQGNYIGTNFTGTAGLGNSGDGVTISASGIKVAGNLISGNTSVGIRIQTSSSNTQVQGNLIGIDKDGKRAVPNDVGVFIDNAKNNVIGVGPAGGARNFISGNNTAGVYIFGQEATANVVAGNYIGLDMLGLTPIVSSPDINPNTANNSRQDAGVLINGAVGNTIGGTTPESRNVISGNYVGVELSTFSANVQLGTGNFVLGNYIGTDLTGLVAQGNLFGVYINGLPNNLIGMPGAGNLISGNTQMGIDILGSDSTGNQIQANTIGPRLNGEMFEQKNANRRGFNRNKRVFVQLIGIGIQDASGNTIGGAIAEGRNMIAGNDQAGVYFLGHPSTGAVAENNLVQGNTIVRNGQYGVLLFNAPNNNVAPRANTITGNGIAPIREFSGPQNGGNASTGIQGPSKRKVLRNQSHPKPQHFRKAQHTRFKTGRH